MIVFILGIIVGAGSVIAWDHRATVFPWLKKQEESLASKVLKK